MELPKEVTWKEKFPFHAAAQGGDLGTLNRLMDLNGVRRGDEKGSEYVNKLDDEDYWSPLQYAAWYGHKDIVASLLKRGAKVDLQNKQGSTALHYACGLGHLNVVRKLLKRGADIKITDNEKRSPIDLARDLKPQNWETIVELLTVIEDIDKTPVLKRRK